MLSWLEKACPNSFQHASQTKDGSDFDVRDGFVLSQNPVGAMLMHFEQQSFRSRSFLAQDSGLSTCLELDPMGPCWPRYRASRATILNLSFVYTFRRVRRPFPGQEQQYHSCPIDGMGYCC